jgi:hypothetical protein
LQVRFSFKMLIAFSELGVVCRKKLEAA